MSDIHQLLKTIRKERKLSLRAAAEKSGLSHSYIDSLEKGIHPKTKGPIKPSPDSLRLLSSAYDFSYKELMDAAGYLDDESANYDEDPIVIEEAINQIIKDTENEFGVSLRDDLDVISAVREMVRSLARMKKKQ
ncbi:helix-turn-helix domain-containing protein [Paenibacillus sp. RS8]